jgi:hypothetical protein
VKHRTVIRQPWGTTSQLGYPVDLECAWQGDQLYLLQCRPITALPKVTLADAAADADDAAKPADSSVAQSLVWNRPEEGEATWVAGHEPVKPLQQSLALYYYQGWAKAFRKVGASGGLRARFVNLRALRSGRFGWRGEWPRTHGHDVGRSIAPAAGRKLNLPGHRPALDAALVTDHGGSLAHAAVVAREYRLPAVVGTHEATRRIQTGQWIEVDGLAGVVRLSDRR